LSCEEVNDIKKSGRSPHFLYHIWIRNALEVESGSSVRNLADTTYYSSSTIFYVQICVLELQFRNWRNAPTRSRRNKRCEVFNLQMHSQLSSGK
jgi:hypothetical protein